jgi:membrane-bound metal-dependent hydrolase YbcI (DUF457 family)
VSPSHFLLSLAHDRDACIPRNRTPFLLPAVIATLLILLDDLVLRRAHLSYALTALTDEPAHALTALLAIAAIIALRPCWEKCAVGWGALLGGTLIDLDHLPSALGWHEIAKVISAGTKRPYPHSFLSSVLVLAVALLLRDTQRQIGLAAGFGLTVHLLRDLVDGGTVPLLWPVTKHGFSMPYEYYAAWLLLCLALITIGQRTRYDVRGTPSLARASNQRLPR